MSQIDIVGKPQRWDKPFGRRQMRAEDIERVLSISLFKTINKDDFPKDLALADIIANDGRIVHFRRGEIIVHKGDYGNSLFVILKGTVQGFITQEGEDAVRKKKSPHKRSWLSSLSQLWKNSEVPECIKDGTYRWTGENIRQQKSENYFVAAGTSHALSIEKRNLELPLEDGGDVAGSSGEKQTFIQRIKDVDGMVEKFPTFMSETSDMFGELSALARSPRNNTVFAAEDDTILLELRWQGLRDIRQWSENVHQTIDKLYNERGLEIRLRETPLFENVSDSAMKIIVEHSLFETYGHFDWTHRFQRARADAQGNDQSVEHEPVISRQDHYLDGLLLIHSGFARVTEKFDHGEKTLGYLTHNDVFGLTEIIDSMKNEGDHRLRHSLHAIGYVDVIRIPTQIVEEYLVPTLTKSPTGQSDTWEMEESGLEQSMLDFLVDNRFINGSEAMAINTDRCVGCDDCVRACASAHDNNPRFIRHGNSHQNLMIANACMHCKDPVCLIDCPTGAIHREIGTGSVVIDSVTCVGCATCANSCPYNNIRMVEIRGAEGAFLTDAEGAQIYKATKCDLCADQLGGPACQRACPHDALIRIDIKNVDKLSDWLELSL